MKKFIFFTVFLCLTVSAAFGQKRKTPIRPPAKKQTTVPVATKISDAEWKTIIDALDKEDWARASRLASLGLEKLRTENEKKQLARLRYFYVYASAGKVAQGEMTYAELEKIANGFIGKEFLMPSRIILDNCKGALNYICSAKDNEKLLRVTATDKSGTIHSFEYVQFREKFDTKKYNQKEALLGGNLKKAEFNFYRLNIRIMRLIFNKGFVNIVSKQ